MENDDHMDHLERVQLLLRIGNQVGAVEQLKIHLSLQPDEPYGHAILSLVLLDQKRLTAARFEAEQAIALAPELAIAHAALGTVLMAQRHLDQALVHLEQAIAIAPQDSRWHEYLGGFYELTEQFEKAEGAYLKAISLDSEDADLPGKMAILKLSSGKDEEVEYWSQVCLSLNAVNAHGLYATGMLLLKQGDLEGARHHAVVLMQQGMGDSRALNLFAAIKARKSMVHGLWWRQNAMLMGAGSAKILGALVGSYLLYRTMVLVVEDLGQPKLAAIMNLMWLGFVLYTWIAPRVFAKSLAKELEPSELRADY